MNTVLVATERDLEQNILAQALDGRGYQLIRSRDGVDALEIARSQAPHLLLANVALSKLDGFALFRRFQQDEQLRRIPIVLFSTRSNDQKSERFAQELGATWFVGNALKPGALNGVIESALAAAPAPPLPAMPPLKKPAQPEADATAVPVTSSGANGATRHLAAPSIDRTVRLPALIALPEAVQIEQLQAQLDEQRQTLQAAQQQLDGAQVWQELFGLSPGAMWIVDKATQKVLAVNDAALRLFAYSQSEFMQLDSPALLRDQAPATATSVFAFRSKDGRALSLLVNSRELLFKHQAAELWVAHDVGYRVRGERAMAEEVQRVKALLAVMPAYWAINAQGQLCDVNATCCQLLGYSREQLLELGIPGLVNDAQQRESLLALTAGQPLLVSVLHANGAAHNLILTSSNQDGAGLRVLTLQIEPEPSTVEMSVKKLPSSPKLPAVLEMLRYAEDADESTLLQYAMAQIANAFDSPLALFASLERITQTLAVCAVNHAQAHRCAAQSNHIAVPAPWQNLLTPRTCCSSPVAEAGLAVEGLPDISSYAACSAGSGRELWVLAVANRDRAYAEAELRELQECAEILVAILARKRQQSTLHAVVKRSEAGTDSLLELLSKLVDQHDVYAAGSGQRVATLALHIARHLGLSPEQQSALNWAARLHDLGHVLLPKSLLLQPSALSATERALMQSHVEHGVQLLSSVEVGGDVASIVAQHHERLDGSGYPAALGGAQISIEARILAVADVVEAMSAVRAYRPAMGIPAALVELRTGAGQQYDAAVVDACEQVFAASQGRWPD